MRLQMEREMSIVLVDNEPELLELVRDVLEGAGYEVLPFARPIPVTKLRVREVQLDLFLVDIMLPDINGIALAARLKDEGFGKTPKVAMSASRRMIQVAKESRLFAATLDKPFEIDTLLNCVGRYATA